MLAYFNELWWSSNERPALLFRGTAKEPASAYQDGFVPPGDNQDLFLHKMWRSDSAFVSTSDVPWSASKFPMRLQPDQERWVYIIQPPAENSIYDVNRAFPRRASREYEYAIEGAISNERIVGAWRMKEGGEVGEFVRNENFVSLPGVAPPSLDELESMVGQKFPRSSKPSPNVSTYESPTLSEARVNTGCQDGLCSPDVECTSLNGSSICKST